MTEHAWNPWKLTTIGLGLAAAVALVTGVVVANWTGREAEPTVAISVVPPKPAASAPARVVASAPPRAAAAPAPVPVAAPQPALPSQAAIDACNQQAAAQSSQTSKTVEILKDGAIGAAIGAAVGAAGGAVVDGGSGAGKGAVIGGVLGAGGGALYGVNENRKNDARYRDVYAGCMRSRGYAS
jgi:hypothetical protein